MRYQQLTKQSYQLKLQQLKENEILVLKKYKFYNGLI